MAPRADKIAPLIIRHFRARQRDLPWRRTSDPYAIWVSEIMLQQTRVQTVIPYYERWLERFPTLDDLAGAELDEVLTLWSGLGYYSRARNLHRGARDVVERYAGRVPATVDELRSIAGIGRYTAGAIASIAHGSRAALVDGNVARVLARVFEIEDDVKSTAGKNKLWKLAEALVPADAPGDFNQGLMELGATVCTPTSPACEHCPLSAHCGALAGDRVDELPVMPRRKRPNELPRLDLYAAWLERKGRVLLWRRKPKGLYGGLWELPAASDLSALQAAFSGRLEVEPSRRPVATVQQLLSHRRLRIRVWPARVRGRLPSPPETSHDRAEWHELGAIDQRGISTPTRTIIARYQESQPWKHPRKPSTCSSRATKRSSKA